MRAWLLILLVSFSFSLPTTASAAVPFSRLFRALTGQSPKNNKRNKENKDGDHRSGDDSSSNSDADTESAPGGRGRTAPESITGKQLYDKLLEQIGLRQSNAELVGECSTTVDGEVTKAKKILGIAKSGRRLGTALVSASETPAPKAIAASGDMTLSPDWLTLNEGVAKDSLRQVSGANGQPALEYVVKSSDDSSPPERCLFTKVKEPNSQKLISLADYLSRGSRESEYRKRREKFAKGGAPLGPEMDSLMRDNKVATNAAAIFLNCRDPLSTNLSGPTPTAADETKFVLFLFRDPRTKQFSQKLVSRAELEGKPDLNSLREAARAFASSTSQYQGDANPAGDSEELISLILQARANGRKFYFRMQPKVGTSVRESATVKRDPSSYCTVNKADSDALSGLIGTSSRR